MPIASKSLCSGRLPGLAHAGTLQSIPMKYNPLCVNHSLLLAGVVMMQSIQTFAMRRRGIRKLLAPRPSVEHPASCVCQDLFESRRGCCGVGANAGCQLVNVKTPRKLRCCESSCRKRRSNKSNRCTGILQKIENRGACELWRGSTE